ncbi:helix-turn-helix transcriptional regulator [Limnochorda pilosa]|uniref:Transcriptional regulator n=1 Tax=Limnochorda pilosa TaxID=1555112 RepID=A0A0K2SQA9_LIMPI|nr:YafY family protein [Limnochorda pilosa]BAS29286.1 transcriptional regulator [Limnochorda pilosa]
MTKGDRLAAILIVLQSRDLVRAEDLARRFEVSVRTIYRDVEALSEAGVPVMAIPGTGGGYRLMEGYRLPPLTFTAEEALALLLAQVALSQMGEGPFSEAGRRAMERILAAMPVHVRDGVVSMERLMAVRSEGRLRQRERAWLAQLLAAVWTRRRVRLRYRKVLADEAEWRKVDPYGIAFGYGRWYVPGYCHLRRDTRTFRLDRIEAVELEDETYEVPPDFRMEVWAEAFFSMPERARVAAAIRLTDKETAKRAANDRLFDGPPTREGGAWITTVSYPAEETDWVAERLLGYAGAAVVESPPELREAVVRLGRAAVAAHEDSGAPAPAGHASVEAG